MAGSGLILELIGAYDNLQEPTPGWNHASTARGLIISFLAVTWICVIFRIYTRLRIIYSPGWDDLFVSLLLISGTLGSICIIFSTNHGLGKHLLLTLPSDYYTYLKLFWIANATYCMSTSFIKLSLLFQYLRVFERHQVERQICIALIVITATWGTAYSVLAWAPCVPVKAFFNYGQGGTCYGYGSLYASQFYGTHLSMATLNMVLDVIIIYLPVVSYIRGNNFKTTQLGFLMLFSLGSLVIAISIWRLASIIEHRAATYPTFDPGWYGATSIILSSLEVDIASICASIPVFWPVLTNTMDKITVTREVKVERTRRFSVIAGDGDEDEIEMTIPSRRTSKDSLVKVPSKALDSKTHYQSTYVLAQVDPLSFDARTETEITIGNKPKA